MSPMEKVMNMSETELEELNKKLKRQMIKKFITKVATGVLVHFAIGFVINMIETKKDKKELTE
jgi:hypothetical protein